MANSINPIKTQNILEFEFNLSLLDDMIINHNLYFTGKANSIRINQLKFNQDDEFYFNVNILGFHSNEMELDIEINKHADDKYIEAVLKLFSYELEYKYEE